MCSNHTGGVVKSRWGLGYEGSQALAERGGPPPRLRGIEEHKLRQRIRELARRHVRWGRRLVYGRLRTEGWSVNHKLVQRIWREEGL